jgi:hypothetical protein
MRAALVGRCGGRDLIFRNSRFGRFNSRLGRRKFPIRAATGILGYFFPFSRNFVDFPPAAAVYPQKILKQIKAPELSFDHHAGRVAAGFASEGIGFGNGALVSGRTTHAIFANARANLPTPAGRARSKGRLRVNLGRPAGCIALPVYPQQLNRLRTASIASVPEPDTGN